MNKLNKMWTALAEHRPAPEYADAWQKMLKERTEEAAWAAARAGADAGAWAAEEAAEAATAATAWAAEAAASAAWIAMEAQRAIDTIRGVES
jgi:hypothetical protein